MRPEKGLLSKAEQEQQGQRQVDPKTQEQYDVVMANGMNILHDEKVSDQIINQIMESPEPIEAIARATVDLIMRLEQSASAEGIQVADNVKMNAANQLMGEIMNLAEIAGMEPLSEEERYKAFSTAVSIYLDESVKNGTITPEQLAQMGQEASQTPEGQQIAGHMKTEQTGQPAGPVAAPQKPMAAAGTPPGQGPPAPAGRQPVAAPNRPMPQAGLL
ncbi:MAG: hypothetical protein QME44_01700 [Thermodesulfobacteriota bacterium]|nr:hypothetical protein [Thermodesulfobacteriota bacterium]